jgi:hypothetical protein
MRHQVLKPKLQETTKIPARLIEFLRFANELIVEGDEATTSPSDDLIQVEELTGWLLASGGLVDDVGSKFRFTYFAQPKQTRKFWELELTKEQIGQIATGQLTELTLWACKSIECGCKFNSPKGNCFYCDWEDVPPT